MSSFRWIMRNGERVLQQSREPTWPSEGGDLIWQDVPVIEEPKEPEYQIMECYIDVFGGKKIRCVDERLVEKLIEHLEFLDQGLGGMRSTSPIMKEYRKFVPKK